MDCVLEGALGYLVLLTRGFGVSYTEKILTDSIGTYSGFHKFRTLSSSDFPGTRRQSTTASSPSERNFDVKLSNSGPSSENLHPQEEIEILDWFRV